MTKIVITLLMLTLLTGCTTAVVSLPVDDAERFSIQPFASVSTVGPMAVSADGQLAAWSDSDLNLHNFVTNRDLHLLNVPVENLCWSPDGSLLAVTTITDGESHLFIFDRNGTPTYDYRLPGLVGRLQWPKSGSLTAGVLTLDSYSFGTHITGQLLQWDSRWQITKIPLFETTIKPATAAQLTGQLHKTFDFDLSPLEDEVLYTRLHAPPAFTASRHLVLHNLQTGKEKKLTVLPLLSGAGRLSADGESMLVSDGLGQVRMQDMWSNRILHEWPGKRFDYNSFSGLLIVDAQLYQERHLLVKLPQKSRAQLSFAGHFMLVLWNKQLYRLDGYPLDEIAIFSGGDMKKLQKLRRLRSRGLIEPHEYRQARERLLQ